jgi:hypothetical protein
MTNADKISFDDNRTAKREVSIYHVFFSPSLSLPLFLSLSLSFSLSLSLSLSLFPLHALCVEIMLVSNSENKLYSG